MFTINTDLAEFFGIMFGDGKLTIDGKKTGYCVRIWCDAKTEKEYADYVYRLSKQLFSVSPSFRYEHNSSVICVSFHSKKNILALHKMGMPLSHKGEMKVPAWILNNADFSAAFLRGLFDTDGGVVFQRDRGYVYRLIKFSMKNQAFAETVRNMLVKLGLHPYICQDKGQSYQVVMRKKNDVLQWKQIVKTSNLKNKKKLEQSLS